MSRFCRALSCAAGILLALMAGGCFPSGDSPLDEQKEPHFITGKNLATQMDFQGAIDAFEKALEVNPHSASAHFELAWLYENKAQVPDYAAALARVIERGAMALPIRAPMPAPTTVPATWLPRC